MRHDAAAAAVEGLHPPLLQARTGSRIAVGLVRGFGCAIAAGRERAKAHGRRHGTEMKVLERPLASAVRMRVLVRLHEIGAVPGTRVTGPEIWLAGMGKAKDLDHRHDTAMAVQERRPLAGMVGAGLERLLAGIAAEEGELERLLGDIAAEAGELVIQPSAGTDIVWAAPEMAPERMSHVWKKEEAQAIRSASRGSAKALCRRLDTAVEVGRARLHGDGDAAVAEARARRPWVVRARLLEGAAAAVAGMLECESSGVRAAGRATQPSKRVSEARARAGASCDGRASRVC